MAVPAGPGLRALRIYIYIYIFFFGGGGVNLWSRLVLLEALGLRGGFGQFSPLFDHSCHLKSGCSPLGVEIVEVDFDVGYI